MDGWEGSEGIFSPLAEPRPEGPDTDESRGRQSLQPASQVPLWEVSAQTGSFSSTGAGLVASQYVVEIPLSRLYKKEVFWRSDM